jgi:hypothetical protein
MQAVSTPVGGNSCRWGASGAAGWLGLGLLPRGKLPVALSVSMRMLFIQACDDDADRCNGRGAGWAASRSPAEQIGSHQDTYREG